MATRKAKPETVEISNFVLDANVCINSPFCLDEFVNSNIFFPMIVVEELDKLKVGTDSVAVSARIVLRRLDELALKGSLGEGVIVNEDKNTRLVVVPSFDDVISDGNILDSNTNDNIIVTVAHTLNHWLENMPSMITDNYTGLIRPVDKKGPIYQFAPFCTLISKDAAVRVKANVVGTPTENYNKDKVEDPSIFDGAAELVMDDEAYTDAVLALEQSGKFELDEAKGMTPNQLVLITSPNANKAGDKDHKIYTQAIVNSDLKSVRAITRIPKNGVVYGISPKNKDQRFALDLLLDPSIKLCSLIGRAGSGKTICALAAGLDQAVNGTLYEKVIVARPVIPMGRDVGYLPGTLEEKIAVWFSPIYDNMEVLHSAPHMKGKKGVDELKNLGKIDFMIPSHIRGRSIRNAFIIIDEAQLLTVHEIKTIISRVGEGSKIVIVGDPWQIDVPYLDAWSNGLVVTTDKFRLDADASKLFAYVNLPSSVRSDISSHASRIL